VRPYCPDGWKNVTASQSAESLDDLTDDLRNWQQAHDHGTFEEVYEALESVVARLEQGQLRLDDGVACYELGVRLARRCGQILDGAELRVSQLDASLASAEAWDAETDFDDETE
jgi:exodeoxyribonuclease VII small subunit